MVYIEAVPHCSGVRQDSRTSKQLIDETLLAGAIRQKLVSASFPRNPWLPRPRLQLNLVPHWAA